MIRLVTTGIPPLDTYLRDVGPDTAILLLSEPGIDPAPYALGLLHATVEHGGIVTYIVNNKPVAALQREADALGLDLPGEEHRGRVALLDAFSHHAGVPSTQKHQIEDPLDPDAILAAVRKVAGSTVVIIDSLSSYLDLQGDGVENLVRLVGELKRRGTVIGLFTTWGHDEATVARIKETFDVVLDLRPVEEITIVRQFLFLERVGTKSFDRVGTPVRVLRPGGVRVFFPKILVTGPYRAGKSSTVKAITRNTVSVNSLGSTVALDHGTMDYKGFSAEVYGTPGQELFDPLLDVLAEEAMAVILVVNSANKRTFPRAKTMLQKTRAHSLPLIVAANHWDAEGHMTVEEIRKRLALKPHIPVIPTVMTEGKGIDELLDALLDRLVGGGLGSGVTEPGLAPAGAGTKPPGGKTRSGKPG